MRGSFRTIMTIVAVPLVGMAIFFFWQWINDGITPAEAVREVPRAVRKAPPVESSAAAPAEPDATEPVPAAPERRGRRRAPKPPAGPGKIVLIIDDLGFEGQQLDRVMSLDPAVSCSILPNGPRAAEFAERLHGRGFEILCHLPMEPRGSERPGNGAILTAMSDEEIAAATLANLESVPHAVGVNNHMGSLATTDPRVMRSVLRAMPAGMYFVDSRTTRHSIAAKVARELAIPTATRHVFLDDTATEAFVRRQLAELEARAAEGGVAIGIGHPYEATLRVLEAELPLLRQRGITIVRASEAVR